jgi:hypothetical protein
MLYEQELMERTGVGSGLDLDEEGVALHGGGHGETGEVAGVENVREI